MAPLTQSIASYALRAHSLQLIAALTLLASPCAGALAQSSGPTPGPTPERLVYPLDPDTRGDQPRALAFVRSGTEIVVLHGTEHGLRFLAASDGSDVGSLALRGDVRTLAATSDGERLVLFDEAAGELILVDVAARAVRARCGVPTLAAGAVLIPSDDSFAIVVPNGSLPTGNVASVVDLASMSLFHTLDLGVVAGGRTPAALSGDGRRILVRGQGARLYEVASGALLWEVPGFRSGPVNSVWLDETGERGLIVQQGALGNGGLYELIVPTGTCTRRAPHYHNQGETSFVVTADGRNVLVVGGVQTRWLDLSTNEDFQLPVHFHAYAATRGARLAVGVDNSDTGQYAVIDMHIGVIRATLPRTTRGAMPAIHAAGPGTRVALLDTTHERVELLDLDTDTPRVVFDRSTGPGVEVDECRQLALTGEGELAVSLCIGSRNVTVTRITDGAHVREIALDFYPFEMAVGGDTLAILGSRHEFRDLLELYSIASGARLVAVDAPRSFTLLGVSSDGRFVHAIDGQGSGPQEYFVIDAQAPNGGPPARFAVPSISQPDGALSPSGRWALLRHSSSLNYFVIDTVLQSNVAFLPAGVRRSSTFVDDERTLFIASGYGGAHRLDEYDLVSGAPVLRASTPLPASLGTVNELQHDGRDERVWSLGDAGLACHDLRTGALRTAAAVGDHNHFLLASGPHAYVAQEGRLARYFDDGLNVTLIELVEAQDFGDFSWTTRALLSRELGRVVSLDRVGRQLVALDLASAAPRRYCAQPVANSTGQFGRLDVSGPRAAFGAEFELIASLLPPGALGLPIVGPTPGLQFTPGGATLCIDPLALVPTGRGVHADASGEARLSLAPSALAVPGGPSLDHGSTWCFQVWHRDVGPTGGSGATDALALYFR
jgi:hypothetical protein